MADESGAPKRGTSAVRRPHRAAWRRFFQISARRRLLLAEAVTGLALARVALLFMPFRTLAAWFGTVTPPSSDTTRFPALSGPQQDNAREIGWAVTRAARYTPFRAVCLPQAIAAKAMLERRHIYSVMHFGVAKKPQEPLAAHAWLDAGPVEVTGFPVGPEFVEVARFV